MDTLPGSRVSSDPAERSDDGKDDFFRSHRVVDWRSGTPRIAREGLPSQDDKRSARQLEAAKLDSVR